jgi:hypothetical protein
MTCMDLPWTWLNPEDDTRQVTAGEACDDISSDADWIGRQLSQAFSDQAATVVLYGWSPVALDWLEAEPMTATRTILWAVRPCDLPAMVALGERMRRVLPRLVVAPVEGRDGLPTLVSRLPYIAWTPAALTGDQADVAALAEARRWRLATWYFTPDRLLEDVAHFLHIEPLLGSAIAITAWRERWRGRTALCIAAGPSLDRRIDFIRQHMDRCLVVAADVVAGRLMERGIKVDFVVNADSHGGVIDRIPAPSDPHTVLICPFEGHRILHERCPRRSLEGFGPIGGFYLGRDHAYNHGTNVGSCTVGFAAYCGCREMILVGHDLCQDAVTYYSDFVTGREGLERINRTTIATAPPVTVLGNDGQQHASSQQFRHGINDLGVMSSRLAVAGAVVYNLNLQDGLGAAIPHVQALPAGWSPAGPGEVPRPGAGITLAELWANRPPIDFRSEAKRQMARYRAAMAALPSDPKAFLDQVETVYNDPDLHLGHNLLAGFWIGRLTLLYRHLLVGGGGMTTSGAAQALRDQFATCMEMGERLTCTVLDSGQEPQQSDSGAACVPAVMALRSKVPKPEVGSVDDVLLYSILRDEYRARRLLPDLPLPEPASAWDMVHLVAAFGPSCPERMWRRLLALVRVSGEEGLAYIETLAAEHGVGLGDAESMRSDDDPAVRAVAALLDLRHTPGDTALAVAAAAWAPLHPALIDAILAAGVPGLPALSACLEGGLVPVDDAIAGQVLSRCVDMQTALRLIGPHEGRLGEHTALAVAQHHLALCDHAAALANARRIGLLGSCAEPAAVLRCRVRWHLDGADGVSAEINAIPGQDLPVRVLWGFTLAEHGVVEAVDQLIRLGIEPLPVTLLSQAFESAGRGVAPHLIPAVFDALLHLTRRSQEMAADEADRRRLADLITLGTRARDLIAGAAPG